MKCRNSGTVNEVSKLFNNAVAVTDNPHQKACILSLLADFLMEKQEWEKAIDVNEKILTDGPDVFRPTAYYENSQAYFMLNKPDKANALCTELNENYPGNGLVQYSNLTGSESRSVPEQLTKLFTESSASNTVPTSSGKIIMFSKPVEYVYVAASKEDQNFSKVVPKSNHDLAISIVETQAKKKGFSLDVKGWQCDIAGDIDARGMEIDLETETDIDEETGMVIGGSWKYSKMNQLEFSYTYFDHSGTINKPVTFFNNFYNSGTLIEGNTRFLDLGISHLMKEWRRASLRFLYGVNFGRMFVCMSQQELTTTFEIPYIGIEGNYNLTGNVKFNGSGKFSSAHHSGVGVVFKDFETSLKIGPDYSRVPEEIEWCGVIGYRFFELDGNIDNDSAEINYSGPTLGIEIRF
ncbi:MAG: tetratricopeptide repeat protein [Candidatus Riflebacteria bacterium]|nr:tetratricopeptide repeat protein [Candidatus Riflebacteria bacterium]